MSAVKRLAGVAAASAVILLTAGGTAWASPPPNDTFAGATVIPAVPYSTTEDTTQATVDASDTAAGQACGVTGLTFSNSVWFAYTPSADQTVALDTSQSSYSVAGAVLTGSPAGFTALSCFLTSTSVQLTAGTTYYIDLLQFLGGSGGTLNLTLAPQVAPNPVVTVSPTGEFDPFTGGAVISGTESCSAGAFSSIMATLSTQPHGRNAGILGFGSPLLATVCDGTAHPWSAVITPSSGLFKGGPTTATVFMFACTFTCQNVQVTKAVNLKG